MLTQYMTPNYSEYAKYLIYIYTSRKSPTFLPGTGGISEIFSTAFVLLIVSGEAVPAYVTARGVFFSILHSSSIGSFLHSSSIGLSPHRLQ